MIIGYNEGVNNIKIYTTEGKVITRKLGVKGVNVCGANYSYYDTKLLLHIINTRLIEKIELFRDKTLVNII